jgi:RNA polymerase sigma-70 factor (ECF subfamily)
MYEQQSDEQLMSFWQGGDQQAFIEIHQRHKARVRGWLRTYLRVDEVDDAVQDAWTKVCRYAEKYNSNRPFNGWLYMLVTQVAIDFGRRRQTRHKHVITDESFMGDAKQSPERDKYWSLLYFELSRLNTIQREVIEGCYLRGETLQQAADRLGWSIGKVRYCRDKALAGLREALSPKLAASI